MNVEVTILKKVNKRIKKKSLSWKEFKKWFLNYKLFNFMLLIATALVALTLWNVRPISMREPIYKNTIDYNEVDGNVDFEHVYDSLIDESNSIKNVYFKLEEGYSFTHNGVELAVEGYELIETEKEVKITSNYRLSSAKHFLVIKMDFVNSRENSIQISDLESADNSEYDYIRALKQDDIDLENNLANYGYKEPLIMEANTVFEGYLIFPLTSKNFRQLYFDGGLKVRVPSIIDSSKFGEHYLMTIPSEIEFVVAEALIDKYITTSKNLAMEYTGRSKGFTSVTKQYVPNAKLTNEDNTIDATIDLVEFGIFEYRKDYTNRRRYSYLDDYKTPYKSIKVTITNNSSSSINTRYLYASLDLKTNTSKASTYLQNNNINIEPGESADLIFSEELWGTASRNLIIGKEYKFSIYNDSSNIIFEDSFILEK